MARIEMQDPSGKLAAFGTPVLLGCSLDGGSRLDPPGSGLDFLMECVGDCVASCWAVELCIGSRSKIRS